MEEFNTKQVNQGELANAMTSDSMASINELITFGITHHQQGMQRSCIG
jgi:hypothetical protein